MKKKADQGIDGILGLSDVEIVRVERRRDIRVWARPTKRPVCLYCGHGGLRIKATHERELKHTRQGNQILMRIPTIARMYSDLMPRSVPI